MRVVMPKKVRRPGSREKHQEDPAAIQPQRHKGTADQCGPWSVPDAVQCIIRLIPGKDEIENVDKQHRPKKTV